MDQNGCSRSAEYANNGNDGFPLLTDLFNLLLSINQRCCQKPEVYSMPLKQYIDNVQQAITFDWEN